MMMMRFFRWQRRRCSGKREKKPTTTSCYYFKTCACVTCWNETLESSRCWRVAEREREREREVYVLGDDALKNDTKRRARRERFSKRYFAQRERERHARTGEKRICSFGSGKLWFREKNFNRSRSIFVNFWQIFGVFVLVWTFNSECFSKTASLKARQLRIKHINYGQKNEIGEKSREIEGTTAELLAREETKLSHLLLPFFFARLSVFIYISDVYISIPPMQRGFLPPILSLPRGLICKIKTHTLLARAFTFLSLSPFKTETVRPETTHARA